MTVQASVEKTPKVSIIVLNWNSSDDTVECIASLRKLNYPAYEIIIVDNGSTDDSERVLRDIYSDIKIIQTGCNLGYAGGNNRGVKYALAHGAEFIWILNNDTVVHPDSLREMVLIAKSNPAIGLVGSKIFYYSKPDTLWCVGGGTFDIEGGGRTSLVGFMQNDAGQFDHLSDIGYIAGTSLLAKAAMINDIGLMPEKYFLYFEETDWNLTAQSAGYRTVLAPKAIIWHKVKIGAERINARFVYYLMRNRFLLVKKINIRALLPCIKYQFVEAKRVLKAIGQSQEPVKLMKYFIFIILAWWHGIVVNRSGEIAWINNQKI